MILRSRRCLSPPQKPFSVTGKREKMGGGWWCWCWCVCVCVCVWGRGREISRVAFSSPLLALPILLLTLFLFCSMVSLLKTVNFSLTWPASMLIYWNKRKYLQEKRVQLPEDLLATLTWPPLRHVKTLYSKFDLSWPFLYPEIHNTTQHMHFIRWHI